MTFARMLKGPMRIVSLLVTPYIATDDGGVSEFTTAAAAAAAAGDDDEGKSEQAKREGDEAKQKEEEEGTDVELSPETVSVHVEAVVAALELLLYSEAGEVAEVKVKGQKNGFITWYIYDVYSLADHVNSSLQPVQYACSYVYNLCVIVFIQEWRQLSICVAMASIRRPGKAYKSCNKVGEREREGERGREKQEKRAAVYTCIYMWFNRTVLPLTLYIPLEYQV